MNEEQNEALEKQITNGMNTYFKAKESNYLTEDNKMLVNQVELAIASLPSESPIKKVINCEIDKYFEKTKELSKTTQMNNADNLRQPVRALVKSEESMSPKSTKAAFINVAILLYGVLNIGIIMAIALMK